jgi:predicted pyridoxine 5'-phosphate oxidase superfamily flavin-nucleotide-binding protein
MEQPGRRAIRDYLTAQHQQFFAQLSYVIVGIVDADGCPWATFLVGEPGFVSALDEYYLQINSQLVWPETLVANITNGSDIGVLGIELHTRRRNRLSGIVTEVGENSIRILVKQSYGNCPQYIQARVLELATANQPATKTTSSGQFQVFDSMTQSIIENADTCFITTAYLDKAVGGVDVSHRGGKPGFVRVDNNRTLTIPDFAGNYYFNTFGNLELNDRAGLLFLDFGQGDLLYLTGRAKVIWEGAEISDYAGAQRLLRFHLDHGYHVDGSLNLHWSAPEFSPFLDHTGSW